MERYILSKKEDIKNIVEKLADKEPVKNKTTNNEKKIETTPEVSKEKKPKTENTTVELVVDKIADPSKSTFVLKEKDLVSIDLDLVVGNVLTSVKSEANTIVLNFGPLKKLVFTRAGAKVKVLEEPRQ